LSFLQELKQKLEKGVETAGQKSHKMIEISRLTLRIKGKKDDIERMISKLGWEIYRVWEQTGKLEMNENIQFSLQAIWDQQEQLRALQKELEEVKKSDIVPRKQVEKVDLVLEAEAVAVEENVGREEPVALPESKPEVPSVIYICPFCAHQVKNDASRCANCQSRFH
jgi:hypothetical protein